jgi:hypothetical protein
MWRVEHRARRSSRQDFSCAKARSPGARSRGVVAVELLVVLRLFAVVLVGGADGGAGALVGAVGRGRGLPCEAGLDDAVGATAERSWVRPGVARENHRGVPSWAAITWTFMLCCLCFWE